MKPIDLIEHPEGGRFREVFRSAKTVSTADGAIRSALTHIYFSLKPGEVSRFHKVASDEIWNLYQGAGLNLYTWDGTSTPPQRITLSTRNNCFCCVIPAGTWQAAEPVSDTVLMGCSVAPGFEFSDFTLIDPGSQDAKRLIAISPEMAKYVVGMKSHPDASIKMT
ncbi:MAG: cupin domain-containing protein [Desulfobacterales bacterium]|nr:cupin domain-containing protein [Desulfobacterales bacterium]